MSEPGPYDERYFWPSLWTLQGAVTSQVLPRVLVFSLPTLAIMYLHPLFPAIALQLGPVEIAGGVLGLLLVLRTNAGYERWWEGRKLWGGIVNASRNLVVGGLAYGPDDMAWRRDLMGYTVAFGHVCRHSLRSERQLPDVAGLLGDERALAVAGAEHMPTFVAQKLAQLLHTAWRDGKLSHAAFLAMENLRQQLVDLIGGCERIDKTPLPSVYVIKLRRFTTVYLLLLPLAIVDKVGWATPLLVMLVAYPALGMDQIAHELQRPFLTSHIGHLPLESICGTIEANARAAVMARCVDDAAAAAAAPAPSPPAGAD